MLDESKGNKFTNILVAIILCIVIFFLFSKFLEQRDEKLRQIVKEEIHDYFKFK